MSLDRDAALRLYRVMRTIRQFEARAVKLFGENKIWGTIHSYAGQEAVAVGVSAHLRDDDWITSTHRGHGHCIAKGADVGRDRKSTRLNSSHLVISYAVFCL